MTPKPDSLEALEVPELGAGASETSLAAVALAAAEPGAQSAALKSRLAASMARQSRSARFGIFVDRLARLFDISLEAAEALVAKIEAGTSWKPGPAEGIHWMGVKAGPKFSGAGAVAAIGRLQPGARFPRHEHVGEETTLVLTGGFR